MNNHEIAERCFDFALKFPSTSAEHSRYLADAYFITQQYDLADAYYSKAEEKNPNYADAFNNHATLKHALKKYDDAINLFNKALAIQPYNATVLCNRGLSYFALGFYKEAKKDAQMSKGLNPSLSDANTLLGRLALGKNNHTEAIQHFEKAALLNEQDETPYFYLGKIYQAANESIKAMQAYQQAHIIKPENCLVLLQIGFLHAIQGSYSAAIDAWQLALNIDESIFPTFKRNLIKIHLDIIYTNEAAQYKSYKTLYTGPQFTVIDNRSQSPELWTYEELHQMNPEEFPLADDNVEKIRP